MTKRTLGVLVVCLLLLAGATTQTTKAQSADAILQQVNQFRLNNGLPAFTYNGALASAAQNQANYMAEFGVFSSHMGYGGSWPQDRANAAAGFFLVANIGFSVPPLLAGLAVDRFGAAPALGGLWLVVTATAAALALAILRSRRGGDAAAAAAAGCGGATGRGQRNPG